MCARMARCLPADGWRVVQRDLLAAATARANLRDATWAAWIEDVRDELDARRRRPAGLAVVRARRRVARACAAGAASPHAMCCCGSRCCRAPSTCSSSCACTAGARIVGSAKSATAQRASPPAATPARRRGRGGGRLRDRARARGRAWSRPASSCRTGHAGRVVWLELSRLRGPRPRRRASRSVERLARARHRCRLHGAGRPAVLADAGDRGMRGRSLARRPRCAGDRRAGMRGSQARASGTPCPSPPPRWTLPMDADDRSRRCSPSSAAATAVGHPRAAAGEPSPASIAVRHRWWAVRSTGSAAIASSSAWRAVWPQGGFPVLRFDCRGMGDSEGEMQRLRSRSGPTCTRRIDALRAACPASRARGGLGPVRRGVGGADVRRPHAARRRHRRRQPLGAQRRVAGRDARQALLRRAAAAGASSGPSCAAAAIGLARVAALAARNVRQARARTGAAVAADAGRFVPDPHGARACRGFRRPVLLILSGNDLTARGVPRSMSRATARLARPARRRRRSPRSTCPKPTTPSRAAPGASGSSRNTLTLAGPARRAASREAWRAGAVRLDLAGRAPMRGCGWFYRRRARSLQRMLARAAQAEPAADADEPAGRMPRCAVFGEVARPRLVESDGFVLAWCGHPRLVEQRDRERPTRMLIARALRERGRDALPDIGGDFALAAWDGRARSAACWRSTASACSRWSTRAPATRSSSHRRSTCSVGHPGVRQRAVARRALFDYLYFHVSPGPQTVFKGLDAPAAGALHRVRSRRRSPSRGAYWSMRFTEEPRRQSRRPASDEFVDAAARQPSTRPPKARTAAPSCPAAPTAPPSAACSRAAGSRPARPSRSASTCQGYDEMEYARIAARHFGMRAPRVLRDAARRGRRGCPGSPPPTTSRSATRRRSRPTTAPRMAREHGVHAPARRRRRRRAVRRQRALCEAAPARPVPARARGRCGAR